MKTFKIFITILCLSFFQRALAQNWRTATPYNGPMNDIVFTDPMTGYACGLGAGIGNCTASGLLLKTIDGGITWTRMFTNTNYALNKLFFADRFTGWALGNSSTVIKTTDGGVTWVLQTFGIGAGYNDIYFANLNTGFVCGENGILRKTTNGGTTFTTIASGVTTTLRGVHFVNANTGYIIGSNGVIRKTINGGSSFTNVYSGMDYFVDITFVNDSTGFVISPYKIFKTINGGSSWTSFDAPPGMVMTRIYFVTTKIGFVIGDSGLLLKTMDGGDSWIPLNTNSTSFFRSIYFTDENTGYLGKDQGQILKSANGGTSWNPILNGLDEELYSVHFRDRALGIAVGRYGGIFRTQNGGLNWTKRNTQTYPVLNCVRWLNHEKVIAVGGNGTILKSDDTGLTWYQVNAGVQDNISDIHVLDSSTIFSTYGIGRLMKTIDGGDTWDTSLNTTSTYPLTGVYFLNADTGYTCGANEVYRTYDGGTNWTLRNDSINIFASFNDIYFTSKDTGYVGGTFGRLYRTSNGGEWWKGLYPSPTTNVDVNEMQFLNNDTGYFAGSTSQRITIDAGVNLYTLPTACLANNWETHSIHVLGNGYGYCVGGQSGLLHTVQKDSILSTYLQDSIFCASSRIFVGYMASGLLLSTQVLEVQLSDAAGSFISPTVIGTFPLDAHMINPSGIATCTLPAGINGTGYRIRVVCNSPVLLSPDNGYDLTISTSIVSDVSLSLVSLTTCQGDEIKFSAQPIGGGATPGFTWTIDNQSIDWHASIIAFDTLLGTHTLQVIMNSSLSCAISTGSDSIQFEVFPAPISDAGIDQSICAGSSTIIGTANNTGPLSWAPAEGLSNDTIAFPEASPVSTQNYVLITTNAFGCKGKDTVLVWVNQLPTIDIVGNRQVCYGDSTLLTANTTGINPDINWSPSIILSNDTGSQVYSWPLNDVTVYASIVDDSSCVNSDSINLTVVPVAIVPTISVINNSIVITDNIQNLTWYLDGSILTGFNNDTLYNPVDGTYQVSATDSNGCSATSQAIYFSLVGIPGFNRTGIDVYYSNASIHIRAADLNSRKAWIELFDPTGRIVLSQSLELDGSGSGEIEIGNISSGIYFSNIRIGEFKKTIKIITR